LWGFWGVFFAIPLATLVKAVVNAWPSNETNG
jgi:perM